MGEHQEKADGGTALPPVSGSADIIQGLLRFGVIDPPTHPGVLGAIGRYDVLGILGEGGMGVVLLARDPATSRQVAIKVVRPELVRNTSAVHRFLVEAHHQQRLSHASVLPILEVSDKPESPYFVMPFAERGNLATLIRPGQPLDTDLVLEVAKQVAEALLYAHSKGIIHRDLKPANILLTDAEQAEAARGASEGAFHAYLSDFGLVRTVYNDSFVDVRRDQCEGTAPYMSPAVAAGEAEDTRCDIYSFGALLYEMLTGRPPYRGRTTEQILHQILTEQPAPINQLNPKAPLGLVKVAEGAMARELRDRYAHMSDIVDDLQRVAEGHDPLGPHGAGKRVPARMIVLAAVAVVCVTAGIVAVTLRDNPVGELSPKHGKDSPPTVPAEARRGQDGAKETIFFDDFNGTQINDLLWTQGQFSGSSRPGTGIPFYQTLQANGSLLLESRARDDAGCSVNQDVWLDSKVDLKSGADVLVEVDYSADALCGSIMILLAANDKPKEQGDPASLRLCQATGTKNKPLSRSSRIRIVLSASSQMAKVYTDPKSEDEFALVDVSSVSSWRLRFYACCATSAGFPPGSAVLRLNSVRASRIPAATTVVGTVMDARTNRPLTHGTIGTSDGRASSAINSHGHFALTVKPGDVTLLANVSGYSLVGERLVVHAEGGKEEAVIVLLKKDRLGFGDVTWSIPFNPDETVQSMALTSPHIYYAATRDGQLALYRMDQGGQRIDRICSLTNGSRGLLSMEKKILSVQVRWPEQGRICAIRGDGTEIPFAQLDVYWPSGLTFDGSRFWFLECSGMDNRYAMHSLDLQSGETISFPSTDDQISGIACGNGSLWVSSLKGLVYEVDPNRLAKERTMEAAAVRTFKGYYNQLSFCDGNLWGLDIEMQRICKITIEDK